MEESLRVQAICFSPEDKEQVVAFFINLSNGAKERIIICNTAAFLRFTRCIFLSVHVSNFKSGYGIRYEYSKSPTSTLGIPKVNYVDRPCFYYKPGVALLTYSPYNMKIRFESNSLILKLNHSCFL